PKVENSTTSWKIFRQSFERPNLSYSVFKVDSKINKIIEVLTKVGGSAIIYCKSRRRTKDITELLQLQNISSDHYHAGLTQEERSRKQEEWINNKTRVIVCTNAFGMGIDKPNVRVVIHADVPDCLENYYQEAGRAGRDGKTSFAVLLHDEKEIQQLKEQIAIRFPSQDDIRNIYQAVANFLQIPTGDGEGQYYDFDLTGFMRKFKLNSYTTIYSLKALEQEGWLAFNEQVFLPSSVCFTTNKDHLYEFEKIHPALEPLIKALLRGYEGIFDHFTSISEFVLSGLLKILPEEIKKQLSELNGYGIIEYRPQKDSPQVLLLRNRIKAEDIFINMIAYDQRKEMFYARSKEMIRFVKEEMQCRSRIIGSYFGDNALKDCGICDNCLRKKALTLSEEEFNNINYRILNTIKNEPLHSKDLLIKLNGVKKEKAWKVIEFLQAENKIEMDQSGWVRLK
ncbi:MAG: RecQ family zinc-binding domain-containing protein, partial [Bacteroidia bacterium]|nr:RecQ family zinc-binding domain-containing protein [Bacteroidia bacterium]